jgi:4-hydroxy-tetrahydrodipicolinate synthase
MFKGSFPALVTPFKSGMLDEDALRNLVHWHIEQGSHGLVPTGTTGESPTLSHAEHDRVIEIVVTESGGKIPVIAGTGSNSTEEAVRLAKHAQRVRADAALVIAPYYNKPSQEGLYQHYKAVHDAVDLPIILYTVPGRCVVDIDISTLARLSKLPRVVGLKDATSNMEKMTLQKQACEDGFCFLSGEDGSALGFAAHGGQGCISVTANVAPALSAQFQHACLDGDFQKARLLHEKLAPLHKAMFMEPSPAPAKYALSVLKKCQPDVRLPLVPATSHAQTEIRNAMRHAGLLDDIV